MMKNPKKPAKPNPDDVEKFIGSAKTAAADAAPSRALNRKKKGIPAEGVFRATIDLPVSVHDALKLRSVQERPRKTMRDLILHAVEHTYGIKPKTSRRARGQTK